MHCKAEVALLGRRILLTRDPQLLGPMENSLFCRQGYSLLLAENGAQAFEYVEEKDPALVILDLDMPGESGDLCCRRIKTDPILKRTPVILVAPRDQADAPARCRAAGCDDVIGKPIDPAELIAAACRHLHIVDRSSARFEVSFSLIYGPNPYDMRIGTAINLNMGGLFIRAVELIPFNTELRLELRLPERNAPLVLRGRVAWVNHPEWVKCQRLPAGMGVEFIGMDEQTQRSLSDYLTAHELALDPGTGCSLKP